VSSATPDLALAAEFFANPLGRHSLPLQHLLRQFRGGPQAGKPGLLCTIPGREWVLAELGGRRGDQPVIHWDVRFESVEDGERHVFAMRWQRHFGVPVTWEREK
jgi:hypothetical protein